MSRVSDWVWHNRLEVTLIVLLAVAAVAAFFVSVDLRFN
jgi:preprotein translocase subunit SecE